MKKWLLLSFAALVVTLISTGFRFYVSTPNTATIQNSVLQRSFTIGCGPLRLPPAENINMPVLHGWGNVNIRINTKSDSAQYFFNQGMGMFYGFHIIEALGSFKKAQQFDAQSPMLYWAEALAYGPNINDMGYAENPAALAAVAKANKYAANASQWEKALINAQSVRYDADTTIKRKVLNERYADAMKGVFQHYANNAEAIVLYADALMQLHPWDWYTRNRQPKEWTGELVNLLENAIKIAPQHTGANHYYIHAKEGSVKPSKALASAWKLVKATPGLAHMVHMPSHIFNQTGFYKEGAEQNLKAIAAYKAYSAKYAPVQNNFLLYEVHNRAMEFANRLMIPNAAASYKSAVQCSTGLDTLYNSLPAPIGILAQNIYAAPLISHVRYSEWDKILQYPAQPKKWIYAHYLQQFARGMALAHKGDYSGAQQSVSAMEAAITHPDMNVPGPFFNEGAAGGKVALQILKGTIAEEQQRWTEAILHLQKGVQEEERMMYNEPKDWLLPAGYYLGQTLLHAKRFAEAEATFKKDLEVNPDNNWSLKGLHTSLHAQKKGNEAVAIQHIYHKKFKRNL